MKNEELRLSPFELEGKTMVDVRYWKQTPDGPKPTNKGIYVEQKMVTRLIWALQKITRSNDAWEAKMAASED